MNRERKKNRNDLIMRDNTIIILTLLLRSTVIRVVRYSVVKSFSRNGQSLFSETDATPVDRKQSLKIFRVLE